MKKEAVEKTAPHLVVATWGSFGDVHPYLAIAQEWQRRFESRGGRATIASCEMFRSAAENAGLGFRAIRPDLPDTSKNPDFYHRVLDPVRGGARYLLRETWGKHACESYDDLFAATHDADVFLSHSMCVVAPLVAAKRANNLRWVSGIVSPMFLQSVYEAPSLPFIPQLADVPVLGKLASRAWNAWLQRWLREPLRPIEDLRHELHLPRAKHPLFHDAHSPHRVLALWSKTFADVQPDWPKPARVVGFCHFDRAPQTPNTRSSTRIEEFLSKGDAPILFTLGASSALDAGHFWRESLASVRQLKRRAIFAVGVAPENWPGELQNLPPDVLALSYVPLSQVVSRCAAVVHHGGIGTLAQCLEASVPSLIMPHSQDQPDNAWRARKMGVARLVSRRNYTSPRVVPMLQTLMQDAKIRHRVLEVGHAMQNEHGAQTACDWLQREL